MKQIFRSRLLATFTIIFLTDFVFSLAAQNLTPEQIQELRKETETAGKALDQVIQKAETQQVRQDAGTAKSALDRISATLNQTGGQTKNAGDPKTDDIYGGGKKYPTVAGPIPMLPNR